MKSPSYGYELRTRAGGCFRRHKQLVRKKLRERTDAKLGSYAPENDRYPTGVLRVYILVIRECVQP